MLKEVLKKNIHADLLEQEKPLMFSELWKPLE